jgi:hypothetical protein
VREEKEESEGVNGIQLTVESRDSHREARQRTQWDLDMERAGAGNREKEDVQGWALDANSFLQELMDDSGHTVGKDAIRFLRTGFTEVDLRVPLSDASDERRRRCRARILDLTPENQALFLPLSEIRRRERHLLAERPFVPPPRSATGRQQN